MLIICIFIIIYYFHLLILLLIFFDIIFVFNLLNLGCSKVVTPQASIKISIIKINTLKSLFTRNITFKEFYLQIILERERDALQKIIFVNFFNNCLQSLLTFSVSESCRHRFVYQSHAKAATSADLGSDSDLSHLRTRDCCVAPVPVHGSAVVAVAGVDGVSRRHFRGPPPLRLLSRRDIIPYSRTRTRK